MDIGGLGIWRGVGGLTCEFWVVFAKNSLRAGDRRIGIWTSGDREQGREADQARCQDERGGRCGFAEAGAEGRVGWG
jgi:hypothetical protein